MINLSLNELKLIAQIRNISDHENKSKEDLIKAIRESETKPKLEPELELEIKVNKKNFKKLRKDFDELRHKFSNEDEIGEYRKAFYNAKICKLSKSEIEKTNKNLNKLKKVSSLKNFVVILIVLIMKILIITIIIMILLMMINIEKLGVLADYLKSLIVIITNQ